jgi:hypothetical protein
VLQSVVFPPILDDALMMELAQTIFRVVKSGGLILWHDIALDNPLARHLRPLTINEIQKLFPVASSIHFKRVTQLHPIGLRVYGMHNFINFVFPFLCTHVIAEIHK